MAKSNSDIYWKGILEYLFADFLRFFYLNADELFDIDRGFEFLDQEQSSYRITFGKNNTSKPADPTAGFFILGSFISR